MSKIIPLTPSPKLEGTKSHEFEYHLRLYHDNDKKKVQELYLNSMIWHPQSPLVPFLQLIAAGTIAKFLYLASALGAVIWPWYPRLGPAIAISAGAAVVVQLGFAIRMVVSRVERSLGEDLADIVKYYELELLSNTVEDNGPECLKAPGPSGFWVVEATHKMTGRKELAGCGGLGTRPKGDETEGELRRVAVSDRHTRRGVAGMLLKAVVAHAQVHNLSSIYLSTSSMQEAAVQLYKKNGWVEEERRESTFLGVRAHAVYMRLYMSKDQRTKVL